MSIDYLDLNDDAVVSIRSDGVLPESVHVFDEDSALAVNTALAARRPLLVRGEPGTGKTQLARAAAARLERRFWCKTIDSRTEARDLCYAFDAVERLAEAQVQGALAGAAEKIDATSVRRALDPRNFLTPGVLWWAFDPESATEQAERVVNLTALEAETKRSSSRTPQRDDVADDATHSAVVLLDEIDKADSSVPNGLLEALGAGTFEVPGLAHRVALTSNQTPLVVVTTNEERALPDAFLRRCVVLHLALPTDRARLVEFLVERGRAHFGDHVGDDVIERCAELVADDREVIRARGLTPPGQAEHLDLLRAVVAQRDDDTARLELLERIGRFALRKHPDESSP